MATILDKAAKGNRSALTQLYAENKQYVLYLCDSLLCDPTSADKAMVRTFEDAFKCLTDKKADTAADFKKLLTKKAVNQCRSTILHKNKKAFRIPMGKDFAAEKYIEEKIITDGDACERILANLPVLNRFISVLGTVAKLSADEIAELLHLTADNVCGAVDAEATNLSRILACISRKTGESADMSPEMYHRLLEIGETECLVRRGMDSVVMNIIDRISTPIEKKAKKRNKIVILSIIACILVVCLVFGIVAIINNDDSDLDTTDGTTETTENEDSDDTTVESETVFTYDALDDSYTYYANIEIANCGTITVALDPESAPQTVANFVALADAGFYDGLTFHRIIEGFMMQGGDPDADGTGGSEYNILGEFSANGVENNLSHTAGAISMARSSEYDSASSQFFIVHEDSTGLDGEYAVFGYVTEGMNVVDQICTEAEPTDDNGTIPAESQPVITSITISRVEKTTDAGTVTE